MCPTVPVCPGLRPSVDLRYIRDNAEAVQANIVARGSGAFANALVVKQLYERSLTDEFEVAQMRKARNALTKKFGAAKEQAEKESVQCATQMVIDALRCTAHVRAVGTAG